VIAVDITTPLYGPDELDSVIPIIEQLTTLLTFNQQKKQYALLGPDDLLITPDLGDIDTADFDEAGLAIRLGHDAIMSQADELAKFATSEPARPGQVEDFEPPVIDAIEISNDSEVSDELIAAQINQKIGEPLDDRQLKRDIESIYGYQYFESVQYEVVEGSDGNVLRITTSHPSWDKELLGITFELYSDTRAESKYNLGLNLTTQGITREGGEWITGVQFGQDPAIRTEFYLPLDYRQRIFARPYASYGEESFNHVENDVIVGRYDIEESIKGIFLGAEFSNKAILGAGLEKRRGNVDTYLGPDPGKIRFKDSIVYGLLEYDALDNLYFPTRGDFAHIRFDRVEPHTAGVVDYDLFTVSLTHAVPLDRHSVVFEAKYRTSNRTFVERHLQPTLGGFKNLSGLHKDALADNNLAYVGVTWLYRLNEGSLFQLGLPVYLGVSIERGNVWADRKDMRLDDMIASGLLMLGVDTPLGPVYVGYGKAEAHESTVYLQLGHLF
jgi:NTE family protein